MSQETIVTVLPLSLHHECQNLSLPYFSTAQQELLTMFAVAFLGIVPQNLCNITYLILDALQLLEHFPLHNHLNRVWSSSFSCFLNFLACFLLQAIHKLLKQRLLLTFSSLVTPDLFGSVYYKYFV